MTTEDRQAEKTKDFVQMDLMKVNSHWMLWEICQEAGVNPLDVIHVHASPPCETFAAPDPTNSSKSPPCHYRDPRDPERAPRAGPSSCPYRMKAIEHDSLVKAILQGIEAARKCGWQFSYTLENPRASLRRRPYMNCERWSSWMQATRKVVDYCSYGLPYRKTSDLWTSLSSWEPKGSTGSGRCERRCGQGKWAVNENGRLTFRHHINLAQDPKDGIRGKGARSMLNSLPSELSREFLTAAKEQARANGALQRARQPVLIDLCSGYGSLQQTAKELGLQYVAVDLSDLRHR